MKECSNQLQPLTVLEAPNIDNILQPFHSVNGLLIMDFCCLDISCPGGSSPCNGNGVCDLSTGICVCQSGTRGADCSGIY